jgi:hypothetical protein
MSGKNKRRNKKYAKKRALRTLSKETTKDSMSAAKRGYGMGKGK